MHYILVYHNSLTCFVQARFGVSTRRRIARFILEWSFVYLGSNFNPSGRLTSVLDI